MTMTTKKALKKNKKKKKTQAQAQAQALTREAILAAAVALADDADLAAVSMRSVAHALGVEAMSLYHHVDGKDALLGGMVDVVFAEVVVDFAAPWRSALHERQTSLRAALTRHPWAVSLLESRRVPGAATLHAHDALIGCLRGAGFSPALVAHAVAIIDAYVFGFCVQEQSLPIAGDNSGDVAAVADDVIAASAGAHPHLLWLMTEHAMKPGYAFADEFTWGLAAVLDAIDRAHAHEQQDL